MKVKVNQETCIGSATCVGLCGEVFELGENNKSQLIEKFRGDEPWLEKYLMIWNVRWPQRAHAL